MDVDGLESFVLAMTPAEILEQIAAEIPYEMPSAD
jgi:hypothetical protein